MPSPARRGPGLCKRSLRRTTMQDRSGCCTCRSGHTDGTAAGVGSSELMAIRRPWRRASVSTRLWATRTSRFRETVLCFIPAGDRGKRRGWDGGIVRASCWRPWVTSRSELHFDGLRRSDPGIGFSYRPTAAGLFMLSEAILLRTCLGARPFAWAEHASYIQHGYVPNGRPTGNNSITRTRTEFTGRRPMGSVTSSW